MKNFEMTPKKPEDMKAVEEAERIIREKQESINQSPRPTEGAELNLESPDEMEWGEKVAEMNKRAEEIAIHLEKQRAEEETELKKKQQKENQNPEDINVSEQENIEKQAIEQLKKKIAPIERDIEKFLIEYKEFTPVSLKSMSKEETEEILSKMNVSIKEKLVSHIANDIIEYHLSILKPDEKETTKEALKELTSGAIKVIIGKALEKIE